MLSFDPHCNIQNIVLVGCGGTGAQIARTLARIVRMLADSGKSVPKLRFVDPDIVESKNVGRQLFSSQNIGMYKAVELARRFNYALGLEIEAFVEPFNHNQHIGHAHSTVIIGAVDNWRARQAIADAKGAIWIDCGNSKHSGQVVIGNTGDVERMSYAMQNIQTTRKSISKLPNAGLVYPELLVPDPEEAVLAETLSCAELLERSLQSATINQFIASIASEYLRKLLYREDIYTWFTTISTTTLSMKSTPITLDTLTTHTSGLSHIAKAQ
ncbi:MAG: ThiF family adenylyltransferase [Chloroflexota bacterium]